VPEHAFDLGTAVASVHAQRYRQHPEQGTPLRPTTPRLGSKEGAGPHGIPAPEGSCGASR
jgi:hypothetical protein